MKPKKILNANEISTILNRLSFQLIEDHNLFNETVLIAIQPRGGLLAKRILSLINKYEKNQRGIYGGCIGFIGFNGDFNHAIIIRSFLSKNDKLFYQAGAGIVMKSDDESERQEVFNKLAALHKAMEIAEEL